MRLGTVVEDLSLDARKELGIDLRDFQKAFILRMLSQEISNNILAVPFGMGKTFWVHFYGPLLEV